METKWYSFPFCLKKYELTVNIYTQCSNQVTPCARLTINLFNTLYKPYFHQLFPYTHVLILAGREQSSTKPNLVAKNWPQTLVTICACLPKLVANVSFQFHHLVNTGIAIGSLVKWLPIMVAHTCKSDTIWVDNISPIGNGSIRL